MPAATANMHNKESRIPYRVRNTLKKASAYTILVLITIASLFPLFWMVSSSLKERRDIFLNPPMWIPVNPQWDNYVILFKERMFGTVIYNSLFITVIHTALALFFCTLAGYAFAKYQFRFKSLLFAIVLASMMVPSETTIIPMFEIYRSLGLIDNPWGVIITNVANAFGIFFMRQYCDSIHTELLEASRIDGCSEFKIFTHVVLPNLRPALASLGIITFVNQWNNFLWPLIVLRSPGEQTVSLAVRALESGARTPYELIMSGSVISVLPLLLIILLFQKQLIHGLMDGAVKG
ncbi:carbohydrate ABC transporter permease [Paenibacillus massiliensis]|uniref:carbohydrate ABC transporter permease n=1 Tax=Paenibacillus massiliensis TaxID=225917 RepID=UPI000373CAA6|nr:carbohydrate ABC transporter permease [Paenibacillus massiliensis]